MILFLKTSTKIMGLFALCSFAMLIFVDGVSAEVLTLNYEGRVQAGGSLLTGPGYFKFALLNESRNVTFWSNDGTSVNGSQPATAVVSDLTNGVFNILIGDPSLSNMQPLNPSIFNQSQNVFLRVWFSDDGVTFDCLTPDKKLSNLELLGVKTSGDTVLYVDPVDGDDKYTGLNIISPKKTIQSAWDVIPDLVKDKVTIYLADGTYEEEVLLSNKSVIGDATISIIGNISDPSMVVVSGADLASGTTPVRDIGFKIVGQEDLCISGIQFIYCKQAGIFSQEHSSVELNYCKFHYNHYGLDSISSIFLVNNCEAADGVGYGHTTAYGFRFRQFSQAIVFSSSVSGMTHGFVSSMSETRFTYSTADNCGYGFLPVAQSIMRFIVDGAIELTNTARDCDVGIRGDGYSILCEPDNGVEFINNDVNISLDYAFKYNY